MFIGMSRHGTIFIGTAECSRNPVAVVRQSVRPFPEHENLLPAVGWNQSTQAERVVP